MAALPPIESKNDAERIKLSEHLERNGHGPRFFGSGYDRRNMLKIWTQVERLYATAFLAKQPITINHDRRDEKTLRYLLQFEGTKLTMLQINEFHTPPEFWLESEYVFYFLENKMIARSHLIHLEVLGETIIFSTDAHALQPARSQPLDPPITKELAEKEYRDCEERTEALMSESTKDKVSEIKKIINVIPPQSQKFIQDVMKKLNLKFSDNEDGYEEILPGVPINVPIFTPGGKIVGEWNPDLSEADNDLPAAPGGPSAAPVVSHSCAVCSVKEKLRRCGKCKIIRYCSVEHQTEHWSIHILTCKPPVI
ncbi:MAG: hypothetical protein Hyperionvirus10_60 [Hyperionvirus sp.]|uniref:MYND-type domain-containing protein n=1 Tax=Hyperionvirus sp. TaxID=2487770 RepID=A0A3G5AAV7_9VIRU|nr:MAG: hypothetical protein Hyperionvirus10_60 [Hyperionvirus sp.]